MSAVALFAIYRVPSRIGGGFGKVLCAVCDAGVWPVFSLGCSWLVMIWLWTHSAVLLPFMVRQLIECVDEDAWYGVVTRMY